MTFIPPAGEPLPLPPPIRVFNMLKLVARFLRNTEGAALVEYGMLVGLIAVACVVAVGTLGATISGYFDNINTNL
jgi:pilus assembly protein Flp/PilA